MAYITVDCEIFPENSACAGLLEGAEGTKMLKAQLMFLGAALGLAAGPALELFRYRSATDYYANGDTVFGSTSNYWEMSHLVANYFYLGMGGLAFFTQLLTLFGIGAEVNLFVWTVGVTMLGGVAAAVSGGLAAYGYDLAYQMTVDSSASAANITAASSVMSSIETETVRSIVMAFMLNRELARYVEPWWQAQMWIVKDKQK